MDVQVLASSDENGCGEPPGRETPGGLGAWFRSDDLARRTLRAYTVIAWLLLVLHYGRGRWFFADDWFILPNRDGGSLRSIVQPHSEHLMALIMVVYRVLFHIFGLNWTPYLVAGVTSHIAVVWTMWWLLRRLSVRGWTATITAGALVLFGPGEENVTWAIQISWNLTLICGVLMLVLADVEAPPGRRDAAAASLGVVAVLSASSLALTVVATNAAACVMRRQYGKAIVHSTPAAAIYVTWIVVVGQDHPARAGAPSFTTSLRWMQHGVSGPLSALAQNAPAAVGLAGVAIAGLVVGVRPRRGAWIRRASIPLAMACASPAFFTAVSRYRWRFGFQMADSPRYIYVGTFLLLPAIALGIDAIWRRSEVAGVAACGLLLIGVPANAALLEQPGVGRAHHQRERQLFLGLAHDPRLDMTPGWVPLMSGPLENPGFTVGWLRQVRDEGRVPRAEPIDDAMTRNEFAIRLGLVEPPDAQVPWSEHCVSGAPLDLDLRDGDELWVDGPIVVSTLDENGALSSWGVRFEPLYEHSMRLRVIVPDIAVRVEPAAPFGDVSAQTDPETVRACIAP